MPRLQPLFPLLRPLAAPGRAPCEQLFRFSTSRRLRVDQPSSTSSTTESTSQNPPKAPAPSPKTPSSPKEPSRAADLAATEAATDADNATLPSSTPPSVSSKPASPPSKAPKKPKHPKTQAPPTLNLPPPRYTVSRSSTRNLPIYTDYKRGGNLHLTTIRKITGDASALRDELRVFLGKKNEEVKINSTTGHVVVKGHHVPQIAEFLKARGM